MQEVVKKEIVKLLDTDIIYSIVNSPWVSPIHCVPKKGGIIVVTDENDELVLTRTITGWRVCIDYHKLNEATAKDHFPLPFMGQMLERLTGNKYLCFLDGFSRYLQIPIDPIDQEKTTFTCPFGTYAYRRMPFGLCNAPATIQRCMLAILHDMIKESVEHCKDAHFVLNWEKCHFLVKEGIVLGHKVSSARLEVDKAKIDVISKLPPPTNIKGPGTSHIFAGLGCLKSFSFPELLNVIMIRCGMNIATTCFTVLCDMLRVSRREKLVLEAEELLLPLAGAEEGSLIVIPFKVSALNVDFAFKIDLIVFGPETGSAPVSFSSRGSGVLQTEDSSVESVKSSALDNLGLFPVIDSSQLFAEDFTNTRSFGPELEELKAFKMRSAILVCFCLRSLWKALEPRVKKLKRSRIAIVKVRWNSKRGPEFTWEREDQMKLKYPHLFSADK
ncbi:reverse transcriptase domain-containing protein [Tanacetum coccineum]|uniref:Reverse transcriptase domain-containing protein n=1 Tax=Tanacetum coccineum TaxID=301880 RepID=A0ABQ5J7E3_9ASTR